MTLFGVGVLGSIAGIGLSVWFEPGTSAVAIALGSLAGVLVSHAFGESVLYGLAAGGAVAMVALGVRALASILGTIKHPPTMASPQLGRVWFTR